MAKTDAAPLPAQLRALFAAARAARPRAHAPYSNFLVGAAVLDERGRVHGGCNVENAAYPQGLCAEASALAAMVLAGGRRARAVAVVAASPLLTTPCGGCRQKIAEFAGPDCAVYVLGVRGVRRRFTLDELLPFNFGEGHLPATPAQGRRR
ncbi:MAG: cytidine deaminase [Burkholderiales bacterium]|nr:cytidine deaminase [Burkholderiales bacterium]